MPFTEKTIMDERLCFIAACLRAEEPMSIICQHYGISRKTGYKWLSRYNASGLEGLVDQSRTPHHRNLRIEDLHAEQILELKAHWPTWGPRKLLARLRLDYPEINWPAVSTVGDLLMRHNLTCPRKRQRSFPASSGPSVEAQNANDSWSADFKGWFRTDDGIRCEPLTISDNCSRFLLVCQAVPRLTFDVVQPLFIDCFRHFGLPLALRTDNGSPFASRQGLGGLTQFSVWLLKLNIWPDRIAPGRPTQNGRHERMHRTLAEDTARPPAATLALQQERFNIWRDAYNTVRPHQALQDRCPAELYSPSSRLYPEVIRNWEYREDHHVIKVNGSGYIKWNDGMIYLTEALIGEKVGLAQEDDGSWVIRFRNFDLAHIDEGAKKIRRSVLARSGQNGT